MEPNVCEMSNELEFCLSGISAEEVISRAGNLSLVPEINIRDVVEMNISRKQDLPALNQALCDDVLSLRGLVESFGGLIYGGSSVLEDTSMLEPRRYRTTSLSNACARGFLDITSQQIVLGINNESYAFQLYETLRKLNPLFLALTASSPYSCHGTELQAHGALSRRISAYSQLCRFFPPSLWQDAPLLSSLSEYRDRLQEVSGEVLQRLADGTLDANWPELTKQRTRSGATYSYWPFTVLEPHQVYWFIRPRPDHCTLQQQGESLLSLELRVPDLPTTVERMTMINSFVLGLSYYCADHASLPKTTLRGTYSELQTVAREGFNALFDSQPLWKITEVLTSVARRGLEERGYNSSIASLDLIDDILTQGNDADLLLHHDFTSVEDLRSYLVRRLRGEEGQ